MNLTELLKQEESESLDFKRVYHSSNVDLLHDILCLANSYTDSDRYLVFGVADDKSIVGIETDPLRKTNANIQDFLRQAHLNRIPTMILEEESADNNHKVDILTIKNRPDKPFFVTKDKQKDKSILRNGVIYTRIGDTNIPLKESASEDKVELMWRERFGLGLDPMSRLNMLLDYPADWVRPEFGSFSGKEYIYHKYHAEFTIVEGERHCDPFDEDWCHKFPDSYARSYFVELRYFTTVLKQAIFVSCDGGRYQIPLPKWNSDKSLVINKNTVEYKIAKIYWQYYPLETALQKCGVQLI